MWRLKAGCSSLASLTRSFLAVEQEIAHFTEAAIVILPFLRHVTSGLALRPLPRTSEVAARRRRAGCFDLLTVMK